MSARAASTLGRCRPDRYVDANPPCLEPRHPPYEQSKRLPQPVDESRALRRGGPTARPPTPTGVETASGTRSCRQSRAAVRKHQLCLPGGPSVIWVPHTCRFRQPERLVAAAHNVAEDSREPMGRVPSSAPDASLSLDGMEVPGSWAGTSLASCRGLPVRG